MRRSCELLDLNLLLFFDLFLCSSSRWKRSFQIGLATIIIVSAVLTLCFVIYRVMKDKFDPKESARAPPEIVSCEHQKEPIDMFSEKIQADVRTLESVIKSKAKSPSGRYRVSNFY